MQQDPRRRGLIVGLALALAAAGALAIVLASALGGGAGGESVAASARARPAVLGRAHDGTRVAVPAAGRPALVTFLFAACPDVCPRAAAEIALALDRLGPRAGEIDVVAVSVDPVGDTPATVGAFLRRHRLLGRMRYVIGSQAELAPIWASWAVAAQVPGESGSVHSARIVIIGRDGNPRRSFAAGVPVPPGDLAAAMRAAIAS
jgi:protein SCO1/2